MLAAIALGVVASVLLARGLGPAGRGTFELARALAVLLGLFAGLGIGRAVVFFSRRSELAPAGLLGAVLVSLASGAVLGGVLAATLFALGDRSPLRPVEIVLASLSLPLVTFAAQGHAALRGLGEERWFRRLVAARDLLFVATLVPALLLESNVAAALAAWLAASVLAAAVTAVVLVRACGRPRWPRGMTWRLAGVGVPSTLAVLLAAGHARLDVVLLQSFDGAEPVGQYAVALGLAEMVTFGGVAVGLTLFPRIAAAAAENPRGGAAQTASAMRVVVGASLLGIVALALIGPRLIELVFGSEFDRAGNPLRALLPGVVGMTLLHVVRSDLYGRGRPWLVAGASGAGVGLNLALNVVLIPRYGATGAAVANSITYTFAAAMLVGVFCLSNGVPLRSCIVPRREDVGRARSAVAALRTPSPSLQRAAAP